MHMQAVSIYLPTCIYSTVPTLCIYDQNRVWDVSGKKKSHTIDGRGAEGGGEGLGSGVKWKLE